MKRWKPLLKKEASNPAEQVKFAKQGLKWARSQKDVQNYLDRIRQDEIQKSSQQTRKVTKREPVQVVPLKNGVWDGGEVPQL